MSLHDMLKKLREGEQVQCALCNKGILKPVENTDYKTTSCFICDNCDEMLNID